MVENHFAVSAETMSKSFTDSHPVSISVIIRAYNRAYILGDALRSVLRQDCSNFEVLVVDDGSKDNTRELVNSFGDSRVRYLQHPVNRGVAAAANTGILEARGEYVAFLDSDDIWKPDYLNTLLRVLALHPESGGVFCDYEIQRGNEHFPSAISFTPTFQRMLHKMQQGAVGEYALTSRQIYICLLQEVPIKPTALLLKRSIINEVGIFNETWPSGEDWEYFLRIAHSYGLVYVTSKLAVLRLQADSTFLHYKEQDKVSLIELFIQEKSKLDEDAEALRAVRDGISLQSSHLASLYLQAGRRRKALAVYSKAYRETGELLMLFRMLAVFVSPKVRNFLVRAFHGFKTVIF